MIYNDLADFMAIAGHRYTLSARKVQKALIDPQYPNSSKYKILDEKGDYVYIRYPFYREMTIDAIKKNLGITDPWDEDFHYFDDCFLSEPTVIHKRGEKEYRLTPKVDFGVSYRWMLYYRAEVFENGKLVLTKDCEPTTFEQSHRKNAELFLEMKFHIDFYPVELDYPSCPGEGSID